MTDYAYPIQLTKGYVAFVGVEDIDLASLRWTASETPTPAGGVNVYAQRRVRGPDGKYHKELMHRVISERVEGKASPLVDHRDGDTLNNRRRNLRPATHSLNSLNQRNQTGVSWDKKNQKWFAYITIQGKRRRLGLHGSYESALEARLKAEEGLEITRQRVPHK